MTTAGLTGALIALATLLPADDPAADELSRQLRARRLNQLLEAQTRDRLSDARLSPMERQTAAFELAATISRRGSRELDAVRRRAAWAEADALLKPHVQAAIGNDLAAFDLRLRHGLLVRERAETTIDLLKALVENADLVKDAQETSARAAEALFKLGQDVERRRNQLEGGESDAVLKMTDLAIRTDFQSGLAHLAVVLSHPPSAARTAAAIKAEDAFKKNAREFSTLPITLESWLGLVRLKQAMAQTEEAFQKVSVFDVHPETPKPYRAQADLLAGQLLLELGRSTAALQKLNVPEDKRVPNSGDWSVALFEALLRGSAPDVRGPELRRGEAMSLLDDLEKRHGRYWKIRGEQVLAKYGDASVIGDNASLLKYVADLRRRRKEWDAAIGLYRRAAEVETKAGALDRAARLKLSAAGALAEKGDAQSAADGYLEVAESNATSALGAEAYLGAAAALYPLHKKDALVRKRYRDALDRTLTIAEATSAVRGEAAWLRAKLAEDEKDPDTAIPRYIEVPRDHPRFPAAAGALAILHFNSLIVAPAGREIGDAVFDQAIRGLEQRLPLLDANRPEVARDRALVAWVLARLLAERKPDRLREAVDLALKEVARNPAASGQVRDAAWPAVVQWQMRLGDTQAALKTVDEGFGQETAGLARRMLQQMSPIEDGLSTTERRGRADVAKTVAERALQNPEKLDAKTRLDAQLLHAQALTAAEDFASADRLLGQLRQEAKKDPRVARSYAVALFRASRFDDSLREWQALRDGTRAKRGSDEWLTYVYEMCRCHVQSGNTGSARALLDFIDRTYPGAGSAGMQQKLKQLRTQIGR